MATLIDLNAVPGASTGIRKAGCLTQRYAQAGLDTRQGADSAGYAERGDIVKSMPHHSLPEAKLPNIVSAGKEARHDDDSGGCFGTVHVHFASLHGQGPSSGCDAESESVGGRRRGNGHRARRIT